jgi:hypothetical protein
VRQLLDRNDPAAAAAPASVLSFDRSVMALQNGSVSAGIAPVQVPATALVQAVDVYPKAQMQTGTPLLGGGLLAFAATGTGTAAVPAAAAGAACLAGAVAGAGGLGRVTTGVAGGAADARDATSRTSAQQAASLWAFL